MEEDQDQVEEKVQVQPSGVVFVRGPDGKFLPGNRPPNKITRENATEYHRKRQEKARSLLRTRIREVTQTRGGVDARSSAEAIAEAGAMLWEEVVLNPDAYPRDRLDAYLKLGQLVGILPSGRDADPDAGQDRDALAGLGREAVLALAAEARRRTRTRDEDQT